MATLAPLLTLTAAAALLGVDRRTVARAIDAGRLPAVVVHRRRFVPEAAIQKLLGGAA